MLHSAITASALPQLDHLHDSFLSNPHLPLIKHLVTCLESDRLRTEPVKWRELCIEFREHALAALLLEDPFTQRAFRKPWGYAGDAGTIDLIYGHPDARPAISSASPLGQLIYQDAVAQPLPAAIRSRKQVFAAALQAIPADHPARICSLGCGHLREVEDTSVTGGLEGWAEYLAVDQDARCLASLRERYCHPLFNFVHDGVRLMLSPPQHWLTSFHLVYAAGLFDYLSDRMAARLVAGMLSMARPGGKVLVANLLPGIPDRAYMEAAMDWWLIYRDESQMSELLQLCPPARVAQSRIFRDSLNCVVYLEITAA